MLSYTATYRCWDKKLSGNTLNISELLSKGVEESLEETLLKEFLDAARTSTIVNYKETENTMNENFNSENLEKHSINSSENHGE